MQRMVQNHRSCFVPYVISRSHSHPVVLPASQYLSALHPGSLDELHTPALALASLRCVLVSLLQLVVQRCSQYLYSDAVE